MAWSTPMTAVSNATLTAAQWNASVRDDLLETAVGKATAAGQFFVSSAANALAARTPNAGTSTAQDTTTSTTYATITNNPAVTVTTGVSAFVFLNARMSHSVATAQMFMSYAVSGASTIAASDATSAYLQPAVTASGGSVVRVLWQTGLTAGSNVFTAQYRVSTGTGTYSDRAIGILPF